MNNFMLMPLMMASEKSALKGLLGALHPGIVHFPIALLAVGALVETVMILKKRREPWAGTPILAYLAAAAAVPASFFGFMLADYGGNEGPEIDLHKWLGLASTVFALAAAGCAIKARNCNGSLIGLRLSLILGAGLVAATGYMGGEIVFDKDHILKHVRRLFGWAPPKDKTEDVNAGKTSTDPDPKQPLQKPSADKVDFAKDIAPMIKDMCFKCHGGDKVKGQFKLNTKATAFAEAASGKAIIPNKSSISKFYTSLVADPETDEYMPPVKEKARPGKDQIEKVKKWIDQGAEWPEGFEFKK
jgi:uncharacterized membrane protein